MRFTRNTTILASAVALFSVATSLNAQYDFQSSWILAEEGRAQQIFFGTKVLVGADVKFGNLGNMPYITNENINTTHLFDDGYIHVPVEDGEITNVFGFQFENAVEGPDGMVESFSVQRYRSAGVGESFEDSLDFSTGWELGSRYDMWKLSNRLTVGFTVAGGFTPLSKSYEATVNGELFRQKIDVPLSGPGIEFQETGSYTSGGMGGPYILLSDLNIDPSIEERVTQLLPNGEYVLVDSEVEGIYSLLGGMGTFRTGTYFDFHITERLLLHFGIGISASYLSYDFTVDQSLTSSDVGTLYQISDNINDGEWLVGAYAELNLVYRFNQKTSIYAGAQTHFIDDPKKRELEDTMMEIRLGTPTQFQAGFEFDF